MTTRTRHSPRQIVDKLETADRLLAAGISVSNLCYELNVSEATYHRWRRRFGGLNSELADWLTELTLENTTLRRRITEAELEVTALQAIVASKLLSPDVRRASVRYLQDTLGVSERFACRVTGQHRSTQRRSAKSNEYRSG